MNDTVVKDNFVPGGAALLRVRTPRDCKAAGITVDPGLPVEAIVSCGPFRRPGGPVAHREDDEHFGQPRHRVGPARSSSNGAPLLELRGVTKRFGPVQALTRIELRDPAGPGDGSGR